ncbi:unnamed protein product, partial [marine sediment metagenome]
LREGGGGKENVSQLGGFSHEEVRYHQQIQSLKRLPDR